MFLLKLIGGLLLALLPSSLKIPLYRLLYRYQIGRDVKIGFGAALVGVKQCRIGSHVRIGHFNLFYRVDQLHLGDHARIGFFNLFRGGERIDVGSYVGILRFNVFNSILQPDAVTPCQPVLQLGDGVVVTTGHWLDFTDRIAIGAHTIIGGRNSSFWTHNRQRTRGIEVGAHCYLGSEIRVAPGAVIPPLCIVALGSVLTTRFAAPRSLIAGNPASVSRPLTDRDLFLVTRKTRADIPDEMVAPLDGRIRALADHSFEERGSWR